MGNGFAMYTADGGKAVAEAMKRHNTVEAVQAEVAAAGHKEVYDTAAREAIAEAMSEYKVVFFGIYGYRIMSAHATREEAEAVAERHKELARTSKYAVSGYTREASEHDFDVRTQEDLDNLTRAIHEGY